MTRHTNARSVDSFLQYNLIPEIEGTFKSVKLVSQSLCIPRLGQNIFLVLSCELYLFNCISIPANKNLLPVPTLKEH